MTALADLLSEPAWTHSVSFAEVDAAGVVNYSSYFCYVDEAFLRWWSELHHSVPLRAGHLRILTAAAEFRWLATLRWQEPIAVSFCVGPIGRSSFDIFSAIAKITETTPIFVGRVTHVHEGFGKPAELPSAIRSSLRKRQVSDNDWTSLCALLRTRP